GHEVHFISYALPHRLVHFVENIFYHEVEMSSYPLFEHQLYGLSLASKMLEVIEYEKLDLIHVHYAIPHATSAYLAKQILKRNNSDIKIVTTLHGTDITLVGLEPSFLPLVKLSIEESDGVTAVSRFLKEKTITNYHIDADIEVIHNFIDTEIYKPVCNEKFKKHIAPKKEKILIHTSNFRPVKRVADTIRILEKVKKKIPTKLVLIGDGPDRSKCEKLARELKLEKDVIFLGKQDGLEDLLSVGDIFLMPSQSESFGLAALEGMACGLPVISSSVGGLPELILHNKTGYIAEFSDVDRMAKYTIELLLNKKKYDSFSKYSRDRAIKLFEKSLIVPQYIKYYEKILGE
ncbi:MAG: N-acetyl-alpha-D-glucosaminyl L-malate synthase BshA, partial [Melioribacteraceae bacterium]